MSTIRTTVLGARLMAASLLVLAILACVRSTPEEPSAGPAKSSAGPSMPVDDPRTRERPKASGAAAVLARQAFDAATLVESPPAEGEDLPRLRLTRRDWTDQELSERLIAVMAAMELKLQPELALEWARQAATSDVEATIVEPMPGMIVTYDGALDDLSVVDTTVQGSRATTNVDQIPWDAARRVVAALADRNIFADGLTPILDGTEVAFVRSGVKGPDGTHERWVDEILFEANAIVSGVPLLDAGVRIGITPAGIVSSLRITSIEVERLDSVPVRASENALRESFSRHMGGKLANLASVSATSRRPVYLLDPNLAEGVVDPQYLISYSATADVEHVRLASRTTMLLLDLTDSTPSIGLQLPTGAVARPAGSPR